MEPVAFQAPWCHPGVFVQHWLTAESAISGQKQLPPASWNSYEISHPSTGQPPTSLACKIKDWSAIAIGNRKYKNLYTSIQQILILPKQKVKK